MDEKDVFPCENLDVTLITKPCYVNNIYKSSLVNWLRDLRTLRSVPIYWKGCL